jgi:triphosphatase
LVSTYFDTPKHKLQRHGMTLRVRCAEDGIVQTVKSAMTRSFARGEWETDLDRPTPDVSKAKDSPLAEIASKKASHHLKPVFETSVNRTTRAIEIWVQLHRASRRSRTTVRRSSFGTHCRV